MSSQTKPTQSLEKNDAQEYLRRRINSGGTFDDLLQFPQFLEIETVNACNARCPFCTIADWERGSKPMTDKLFKKIAEEVIEHADHLKRVMLYRDGEPLIDKKLAARTAMLKEGGVKNVGISTNVSLLNETKSRELLEAGLDTIILSIDSLNKEMFESIRVRLIFEEVMENAHKFIELRNEIRPQTKIWMRMVRTETNQHEWPSYLEYWKPYMSDNDRVYYRNIFNWGGQLQGFKSIAKSYEPNLPCVALWSLVVIFCNGDVPLCNVDFNNKFPTGSVVTHSIAELWRSKISQERRKLHIEGEKGQISICANCNVWDESPDSGGISSQYADDVELQA